MIKKQYGLYVLLPFSPLNHTILSQQLVSGKRWWFKYEDIHLETPRCVYHYVCTTMFTLWMRGEAGLVEARTHVREKPEGSNRGWACNSRCQRSPSSDLPSITVTPSTVNICSREDRRAGTRVHESHSRCCYICIAYVLCLSPLLHFKAPLKRCSCKHLQRNFSFVRNWNFIVYLTSVRRKFPATDRLILEWWVLDRSTTN